MPHGNEPTYNVVDDTNMTGNNGSRIVEYLEDRLGPTQDALDAYFMCMPE